MGNWEYILELKEAKIVLGLSIYATLYTIYNIKF